MYRDWPFSIILCRSGLQGKFLLLLGELNPLGIHTKALSPLYSLLSSLADLSEKCCQHSSRYSGRLDHKKTPSMRKTANPLVIIYSKYSQRTNITLILVGKRIDRIKVWKHVDFRVFEKSLQNFRPHLLGPWRFWIDPIWALGPTLLPLGNTYLSVPYDLCSNNVGDPDPVPDPQDPHFLGLPDPDLFVRGTVSDPSLFS
jgi:hypothetical protein